MKPSYPSKALALVLALLGWPGVAAVHSATPPGHIRFVNAAGLAGKVSLTIDTLKLKPEGFAAGDTTGSIGILSGSHQFTVASAEAGTATATVTIQPNGSVTMIAYCKATVDPITKTPKKTIQLIQRANPPPDRGRHFQVLYLSNQPATEVILNNTPRRVDAMREVAGEELSGGDIKVEQGGRTIVTFVAPGAGNFLVILYEDSSGKLVGVVLPDYT